MMTFETHAILMMIMMAYMMSSMIAIKVSLVGIKQTQPLIMMQMVVMTRKKIWTTMQTGFLM